MGEENSKSNSNGFLGRMKSTLLTTILSSAIVGLLGLLVINHGIVIKNGVTSFNFEPNQVAPSIDETEGTDPIVTSLNKIVLLLEQFKEEPARVKERRAPDIREDHRPGKHTEELDEFGAELEESREELDQYGEKLEHLYWKIDEVLAILTREPDKKGWKTTRLWNRTEREIVELKDLQISCGRRRPEWRAQATNGWKSEGTSRNQCSELAVAN